MNSADDRPEYTLEIDGDTLPIAPKVFAFLLALEQKCHALAAERDYYRAIVLGALARGEEADGTAAVH